MVRSLCPVALCIVLLVAAAPLAPVSADTPAAATVTHHVVTSFDGTPLAASLFVPAGVDSEHRVPFVLRTHGWAGSRETGIGTGTIASLVGAGYGVLTWDSRGFGRSGGMVELDSPDYEVKDVIALIDWLVLNAPVAMEGTEGPAASDPLVGMSGGSYAGGIQLLSAAFDDRLDAIAPEITWNNLLQALAPNGVPKLEWIQLLFYAGVGFSCQAGPLPGENGMQTGCVSPDLVRYYADVMATNQVSPEVAAALLHRSPSTYMADIQVPALLIQGISDDLFDGAQAVANYQGIKANGQPVKLWLYDGGHAQRPGSDVPNTQASLIPGVVTAWMDCHLRPVAQADCSAVGPEVEAYTSAKQWVSGDAWPLASGPSTMTTNQAHLFAQSAVPNLDPAWHLGLRSGPLLADGATHVVLDVTTTSDEAYLVGSLSVRDDATGAVSRIQGQQTPVRMSAVPGVPLRVAFDLVPVAAQLVDGQTLMLTLSSGDHAFANHRVPGLTRVEVVEVTFLSDAPPTS